MLLFSFPDNRTLNHHNLFKKNTNSSHAIAYLVLLTEIHRPRLCIILTKYNYSYNLLLQKTYLIIEPCSRCSTSFFNTIFYIGINVCKPYPFLNILLSDKNTEYFSDDLQKAMVSCAPNARNPSTSRLLKLVFNKSK